MDKKVASIVAYIGLLGFLISLLAAGEDVKANPGYKQHLNEGLILGICDIIPVVNFVAFVFQILGIIRAAQDNDEPLPLIGGIKIIK